MAGTPKTIKTIFLSRARMLTKFLCNQARTSRAFAQRSDDGHRVLRRLAEEQGMDHCLTIGFNFLAGGHVL